MSLGSSPSGRTKIRRTLTAIGELSVVCRGDANSRKVVDLPVSRKGLRDMP